MLRDWLGIQLGRDAKLRETDPAKLSADELEALTQLHERFDALLASETLGPHNVSPKVRTLIDALATFERPRDIVGICFVQHRHHCAILAALLRMSPQLQLELAIDVLVGHESGKKLARKPGDTMTANQVRKKLISNRADVAQQDAVVQSLREGRTNFLIATSVAEEGAL